MSSLSHTIPIPAIFLFFLDGMFSWFTPKWRRHAHMVRKGAKRFLNYRRDVLPEEEVSDLEKGIADLSLALKRWDREKAKQASEELEQLVDSVPGPSSRTALAENIEVFFVIFVIFLGIRAYIAQPFRIPTGSMQPSLNGIRIIPCDEDPGFFKKLSDIVVYGGSYINEQAKGNVTITGYSQKSRFLLFTYTTVHFDNGSSIDIPCAKGETARYFMSAKGSPFASFSAGETIIKARVDAGDMIIVNKMAYHFRKPKMGETFVFDTRGIEGIRLRSDSDQAGGTHYVKRLCGLPGNNITIKQPHVLVDGVPPSCRTIERVADGKPPYNKEGYIPASNERSPLPRYLAPGQTLRLVKNTRNPERNQYCALGDNTVNSLDSRYWGPVSQYNIVGPASFALWPFTSHWGYIP